MPIFDPYCLSWPEAKEAGLLGEWLQLNHSALSVTDSFALQMFSLTPFQCKPASAFSTPLVGLVYLEKCDLMSLRWFSWGGYLAIWWQFKSILCVCVWIVFLLFYCKWGCLATSLHCFMQNTWEHELALTDGCSLFTFSVSNMSTSLLSWRSPLKRQPHVTDLRGAIPSVCLSHPIYLYRLLDGVQLISVVAKQATLL